MDTGGSGGNTATAPSGGVAVSTPQEVRRAIYKLVTFVFFHVVALSSTGAAVSKLTLHILGNDSSTASYVIGVIATFSRLLNFISNPLYGLLSDRSTTTADSSSKDGGGGGCGKSICGGGGRKRFLLMSVSSVTAEMVLLYLFGLSDDSAPVTAAAVGGAGAAGATASVTSAVAGSSRIMSSGVTVLVIAGILRGTFDCTITLASAAMMDLSFSPAQYSQNFVYISVAGACGIVIGPALGAATAYLNPDDLVLPFAISAGIEGMNVLWLLFVLPETTKMVLPRQSSTATSGSDPSSVEVVGGGGDSSHNPQLSPKSADANDAVAAIANAIDAPPASGGSGMSEGGALLSPNSTFAANTVTPPIAAPGTIAAGSAGDGGSGVSTTQSSSSRLSASRNAEAWYQVINPFRTFKIIFATPYVRAKCCSVHGLCC